MNSGRLIARAIAMNVPRRNYGKGQHFRPATMNELPVPEGDFYFHHAAMQRKHNSILALGIFLFGSALYITYESKIINFNFLPPETYE